VPNNYGGFEEFAEHVSKLWAKAGHEVFVYCEDGLIREPFEFQNVTRVVIKSPMMGGTGQFFYDYLSTADAIERDLDVIYHAGYATSVVGNLLFKNKLEGRLVYNMDGLEWKRAKFNKITRWLTKKLEKAAALSGAELVSDNKGIQDYLKSEYGVSSTLIEYGADIINDEIKYVEGYPKVFDLVIARFEPENHIEEIIIAYENQRYATLVLVANMNTKLYHRLSSRIKQAPNIIFNGPIYDKEELAFLKTSCRYYIHGHSVGGTNPSLLAALAGGCNILIHDNDFNKDVVGQHAQSWSNQKELEYLISKNKARLAAVQEQKKYCSERFDWNLIAKKHLELFEKLI
jgi:glycosyltransferase involved in cell wall biosynthesis